MVSQAFPKAIKAKDDVVVIKPISISGKITPIPVTDWDKKLFKYAKLGITPPPPDPGRPPKRSERARFKRIKDPPPPGIRYVSQ